MEQQNKITKQRSDCGACWEKYNEKGIRYLAIKVTLNGKDHYLKGFLNAGKIEGDKRPEFLIYPSKPIIKEGNRQSKLD